MFNDPASALSGTNVNVYCPGAREPSKMVTLRGEVVKTESARARSSGGSAARLTVITIVSPILYTVRGMLISRS